MSKSETFNEINAAQRYRSLALHVADFVSMQFNLPFDLTNIEEKKSSYEDFGKSLTNDAFTSEFNCYGLRFLSCISPEIIFKLNNHMLGISEEKEEKKEGENTELTFGQRFIGKQLNLAIANSYQQQVDCNYIKSCEKLSLFRLFFNDDKTVNFTMTCKINDEEIGKIGFCHSEAFFERMNEKAKEDFDSKQKEAASEKLETEKKKESDEEIQVKKK